MTVSELGRGGALDPNELEHALSALGWEISFETEGVYRRWRPPTQVENFATLTPSSIIIPLDPKRGDYGELISDAFRVVGSLTALEPKRVEQALAEVAEPIGDTLLFRKETPFRAGRVPWLEGRVLFDSAEQALLAAAKTVVNHSAYYGNTYGAFARRFLDKCVMGQTQVGSFIVTALTPVDGYFPESQSRQSKGSIVVGHTGRDITRQLATALEAAQWAAAEYRTTGSVGAFEDSVSAGVSREMTEALHSMVAGKFAADVTMEWSTRGRAFGAAPLPISEESRFEFTPDDAQAFETASKKLSTLIPSQDIEAVGWVSVISRPQRGEAGVIKLRVLSGTVPGILRVRVTEQQFELAMESMRLQEALSVVGRLEIVGKSRWVDRAQVGLARFPEENDG